MHSGQTLRQDAVLIMARGDSRRMGRPKGLVKIPNQPHTFLEMIASFYSDRQWPVFVIHKPEDTDNYRPLLIGFPGLVSIEEEGGQDTAQSVLAAWDKILSKPSHLWIHPVDMPLINPPTISLLHTESQNNPDRMLRPSHNNVPGHPVIIPASCLDTLTEENPGPPWPPGAIRIMIAESVAKNKLLPMLEVPVGDPDVTKDFDSVSDLA